MKIGWTELLASPRWMPLCRLNAEPIEVDEGLYAIAPHTYVLAGPFDENYETTSDGPRMTSVMWASCHAAAIMASNEIGDTEGLLGTEVIYPAELMIDGGIAYAELIRGLKSVRGQCLELEIVLPDGDTFARAIRSGRITYYYRPSARPDEKPFAIKIALEN
jgi:hypothetical protein